MPTKDIDILFASAPCQPYSAMRHGSGPKDPKAHHGFNVMFGKEGGVASAVQVVRPRIFISEQVKGFSKPYSKDVPEFSAKTDLVDRIMTIKKDDGTYHFACHICITLDSKDFIDGSRPRSLHLPTLLSASTHAFRCVPTRVRVRCCWICRV